MSMLVNYGCNRVGLWLDVRTNGKAQETWSFRISMDTIFIEAEPTEW